MKLKDASLAVDKALVGAEWLSASSTGTSFDVTNPSTGEVIATLPDMGREEVDRAVNAAFAAQKAWATRTGKDRAAILRKLCDLMVANADDLATILTMELGKPWPQARGEILCGASYVEWFGEEANRTYGDTIPGHQADKRLIVIKQPVGVVGAITPWNFPNAMLARKMAPALAAGCSIVSKPAAQTPLSALALATLAERAGLPPGLFSVLTATDAAMVGQKLCRNDKIRKLTFTGSTHVGKILMRQGADQVLKLGLELGGNAPFIVFDDADLDAPVEGAMISKYRNAGQTCVCANRLYVQAGVYEAFANKLV
ncbi:acyl-CoA reductase-like NAD-dependent aldehyde dehydrogenase [Bradyrhizobium sp. USDA 3397]